MRILGGIALVAVAASAAQAINYVPNPGFESCATAPAAPDSWAAFGTESVVCDATTPETGSYALALSNATNMVLARAESACVVVPPGTPIDDLSFAYRTSSASVYQVALTIDSYTAADCTGTNGSDSTGAGSQYGQALTKDGNWHALTPRTATIDPATNSVRFTASFQAQVAQITSTVDFDDLSFTANAIASTSTTDTPASSTTSTTGTGSTTSTTVPTLTGTGNRASECFVTVTGPAATGDGRVACVDGDPACDADGVANGACAFDLRVCIAEVLSGCHASSITAVNARPASLHVALPPVPASAPTCGPETQLVVPLPSHGHVGRRTLTLTAENTGKPKRERDRIRFQCRR